MTNLQHSTSMTEAVGIWVAGLALATVGAIGGLVVVELAVRALVALGVGQ